MTRPRQAPGRNEEEEWPNAAKKKAGNWVNAIELAPPDDGELLFRIVGVGVGVGGER